MLANRWAILALLFAVRCGMGFQFQSVPALAPLLIDRFDLSLAHLGLLIGLYQSPGIALALPGGEIARRYGDKPTVLFGLALMTLGGILAWQAQSPASLFTARLVSGLGGILINVIMTKMVADWFSGKELSTAMALFINSWPVGIACAMLTLPSVAALSGTAGAFLLTWLYPLIAAVLMLVVYRERPASNVAAGAKAFPPRSVLLAVITAGAVWGFYNVAMGAVLGFASLMLTDRGWNNVSAGAAASVVLWMVAVTVPLGGAIADWSKRRGLVILGGLFAFAVALAALSRTDAVFTALAVAGAAGGIPAGAIMSLAPQVLTRETRAVGMGVFFTVFYLLQLAGPWLIGHIAERASGAATALDLGAAACIVSCVCFAVFSWKARLLTAPIK
jgi:MFS family permease